MSTIHQLIENERKKAGLTLEDMAKKLKVPRSTYQYYEKKDPKPGKLLLIEKALNLQEGYFRKKVADEKLLKNRHSLDGQAETGASTFSETLLQLAESNKQLAEANRVLARNQENLIRLIKPTDSFDQGIPATLKERFSNILELIALIGTGTRWNSVEEATEVLNKYAIVQD